MNRCDGRNGGNVIFYAPRNQQQTRDKEQQAKRCTERGHKEITDTMNVLNRVVTARR